VLSDAWKRGQAIQVHAWIYALNDGKLRALNNGIDGMENINAAYKNAIHACFERANG
jgi:carbonic anhydrase